MLTDVVVFPTSLARYKVLVQLFVPCVAQGCIQLPPDTEVPI